MRDWLPILILGALVVAVWRLANRKPDSYVFGDITAAPNISAVMASGEDDAWVSRLGMMPFSVTGGGATNVANRGDYKQP